MTWQPLVWGALLGSGVLLVVSWVRARRPSLGDRIAPYVRASTAEEIRRRSVTVTPLPTLERLLAPVLRDGVRLLERYGSPADQVRRRLRRAGSATTVEQFRAQQVMAALGALVVAVAFALMLAATRGTSIVPLVVMVAAVVVGAMLARDA
ncbi:MAG: pilus assembly protein TadB, partial [Demequina sp.]